MNGSLTNLCRPGWQADGDPFIWIRCTEAGKHLRHARQRLLRTGVGHSCFKAIKVLFLLAKTFKSPILRNTDDFLGFWLWLTPQHVLFIEHIWGVSNCEELQGSPYRCGDNHFCNIVWNLLLFVCLVTLSFCLPPLLPSVSWLLLPWCPLSFIITDVGHKAVKQNTLVTRYTRSGVSRHNKYKFGKYNLGWTAHDMLYHVIIW